MHARRSLAVLLLTAASLGALCRPAEAVILNPRYGHTATLMADGNLLIVGGQTSDVPALEPTNQIVNEQSGLINNANAAAPYVARTSHTATMLPNGEILIAGGWDNGGGGVHSNGNVNKSVVIYNPVQNCWRNAIDFVKGAAGRYNHTATLLTTGDVLICGGETGAAGNPTDGTCDLFHPTIPAAAGAPTSSLDNCAAAGGTMDATGVNLLVPRALHSATLLQDGRVFLTGGLETQPGVGGRSLTSYMVTSEVYTPGSATTGSASPLIAARAYHRASLMGNGKVLIVGGYNGSNPGANLNANRGYLDSTEIYDPSSDHVSPGGQIPMRVSQQSQVVHGDGTLDIMRGLGNITTTYFNASGPLSGASSLTGAFAPTNVLSTMNVTAGLVNLPITLTLGTPVTGRISDGFILFSSPTISFTGGVAYLAPGVETGGVFSGTVGSLNGMYVGCGAGGCGTVFSPTLGNPTITISNPGGQYFATPSPTAGGTIFSMTGGGPSGGVNISTVDWTPHGLTSNGISAGQLLNSSILSGDVTLTGIAKPFIGGAISSAAFFVSAGQVVFKNGTGNTLETITLTNGMGRFSSFSTGIQADAANGGLGKFTGHLVITDIGGTVACTTDMVDDPPPPGKSAAGLSLTALSGQLRFASTAVDLSDPSITFAVDVATVVIRQMAFADTVRYTPQTNSWNFITHSLTGGGNAFGGTATLEPSASVRRIGGRRCKNDLTCSSFPPTGPATGDFDADDGSLVEQLNGFTAVAVSMSSQRTNHTSTLLPSGKILIAGGSNGPNVLATSDLFDPNGQKIAATGSLNQARDLHTATLLPNGRVLVAGGFSTTALSSGPTATAEIYYPNIERWVFTSPMPTAADNHTATLLPNGNVLVAGGFANGVYLSKAQVYISTMGVWQPLPDMNDGVAPGNKVSRALHTATTLQDGRVLITGGINQTGVLCTSILYDPNYTGASAPWAPAASMSISGCLAAHSHSASMLKDGRVLVTGGTNGVGELNNTLIYTPSAVPNPDNAGAPGVWSQVGASGQLNIKRFGHAAMLTPNGKIMIMGGAQSLGNSVKDVETFDAAISSFQIVGQLTKGRFNQTTTIGKDGFVYVFGGSNGVSPESSIERNYFTGFPDSASLGVAPGTRQAKLTSVDVSPVQGIDAASGNNFSVMVASNTSNGPFMTIAGINLLGLGESAGGGAASGNSDFHNPRFVMQSAGGSGGTTSQNSGEFTLDLSTRVYFPKDANNWTSAITSMTLELPHWNAGLNKNSGLGGNMLPYGWYHLRGYTNSVYSDSLMVQVGPPLPLAAPILSSATVLGISSVTWSWTVNPALLPSDSYDGFAVYSSSSGVLITTMTKHTNPSFTLTNLAANTTGSMAIAAYNASGDGPLLFSSTFYTLCSTPAFNTARSSPAFTSVGFNSLTLTWDPNGNQPGTVYEIYQSTDDFVLNVTTPVPTVLQQTSTSAVINFLQPNTKYGFMIRAFNGNSQPSGFSVEVSTPTRAPVSNVVGSPINTTSIQWTWLDPGGVIRFNVYSTTGAFLASVPGPIYLDQGISTNTSHSIMVTAVTASGEGPLSPAATMYTLAALPGPVTPAIINLSSGSFTAQWTANGNPLGTDYRMQVLDSGGAVISTFDTPNFNAGYGGFTQAGSAFTVRVEAINGFGVPSGFLVLGSSSTTAFAPASLTVLSTTLNSITVGWLNGVNGSSVTYEVTFSTDDFATDVKYALPFAALATVNTFTIPNLQTSTTYGIQVQAQNAIGVKTAYSNRITTSPFNGGVSLGALGALVNHTAQTTIAGTVGLNRAISILIPANTFLSDTFITVSTFDASGAGSKCSGGVNIGLNITPNPYIQPVKPFFVTIAYTPAELAAIPTSQAAMERVDPAAGVCVPLNTTVDTAGHTITAQLNHLSSFQVANVPPSTDPDSTVIFPNPFLPSQGNGFVTLKNMPASARVRIFTLRGELVFDSPSNGSGILTWGGQNLFGRSVASGVYLVVIEAGGKKSVQKVVVLR